MLRLTTLLTTPTPPQCSPTNHGLLGVYHLGNPQHVIDLCKKSMLISRLATLERDANPLSRLAGELAQRIREMHGGTSVVAALPTARPSYNALFWESGQRSW